MTRHSWFVADWPISMRSLAARLKVMPFTDTTTDGFFLERVRDTSLEGTYHIKVLPAGPTTDPFGREVVGEVVYKQVRFVASNGPLGLELIDAPRGNQRFVSRLLEVSDFALTISPVRVDVHHWAGAIAGLLGVPVVADVVQYGSIELGGGATARVVVRGAKDVREAAEAFISRPHAVEKVQLRLGGDLAGSSLLLGHEGTAKISGRENHLLGDAVRSALAISRHI